MKAINKKIDRYLKKLGSDFYILFAVDSVLVCLLDYKKFNSESRNNISDIYYYLMEINDSNTFNQLSIIRMSDLLRDFEIYTTQINKNTHHHKTRLDLNAGYLKYKDFSSILDDDLQICRIPRCNSIAIYGSQHTLKPTRCRKHKCKDYIRLVRYK